MFKFSFWKGWWGGPPSMTVPLDQKKIVHGVEADHTADASNADYELILPLGLLVAHDKHVGLQMQADIVGIAGGRGEVLPPLSRPNMIDMQNI